MSNKTLVFTATYNESENIKKFLDITLKFKNIDYLKIKNFNLVSHVPFIRFLEAINWL